MPVPTPAPRAFDLVVLDLDGTLVLGGRRALPGARELIGTLVEGGHRVALASLAGGAFVEAALRLLGEGLAVDQVRCLDSPGCDSKRAMLEDLCLTLGTRSAVMVGDTGGDEQAAREAGLPFVHFRGSGAARLGPGRAELSELSQLPALLAQRSRRLEALWDDLDRPRHLALVGAGGSGVDLLARDLAGILGDRLPEGPACVSRWGSPGDGGLEQALEGGGAVIAHGSSAASGWPGRAAPRVVEVRAAPRLVAERLRARHRFEGPQAVRAALEREVAERLQVACSAAERPPDAWVDGGDVLWLGRPPETDRSGAPLDR